MREPSIERPFLLLSEKGDVARQTWARRAGPKQNYELKSFVRFLDHRTAALEAQAGHPNSSLVPFRCDGANMKRAKKWKFFTYPVCDGRRGRASLVALDRLSTTPLLSVIY